MYFYVIKICLHGKICESVHKTVCAQEKRCKGLNRVSSARKIICSILLLLVSVIYVLFFSPKYNQKHCKHVNGDLQA